MYLQVSTHTALFLTLVTITRKSAKVNLDSTTCTRFVFNAEIRRKGIHHNWNDEGNLLTSGEREREIVSV